MLEIKDLFVSSEGREILKGVSLRIKPGEIHCLMGPNGSGKSSLSLTLLGHPRYQVTSGKILLNQKNITILSPDKRAKLGLYLAMQSPAAVSGVSVLNLLRSSYKTYQEKPLNPTAFLQEIQSTLQQLDLDQSFLKRSINDSFSGGEKKKVEVLLLSVLKPRYLILDETDSGLDVDALKVVGEGIKKSLSKNTGVLLITHYQRILKFVKPDFVHVLVDGKIVESGGAGIVEKIEEKGYHTING